MSAALSEQQLAEIRARVEGIAPGPWTVEYDACDCDEGCASQLAVGFGPFTSVENSHRDVTPEAEFAAAARTDVPALLAEVKRLQASAEGAHRRIGEVLDYLATKDATQLSEDAGVMGFHIVAVLDGAQTAAEAAEQKARRRAEVLREAGALADELIATVSRTDPDGLAKVDAFRAYSDRLHEIADSDTPPAAEAGEAR